MSFLSIVICNRYISVMADSRASEVYTDGRFHKSLSENEEKIKKVNESIFYSVTGILEDAEEFIVKSDFKESVVVNGVLKEKNELEKWFTVNSYLNTSAISYRIIFGGLSIDTKFRLFTIESGKDSLEETIYKDGSLSYSLSPSIFFLNNDFPQKTFIQLMEEYDGGSVNSIQLIQKKLNDIIAEIDPSVNKNTKTFLLEYNNTCN